MRTFSMSLLTTTALLLSGSLAAAQVNQLGHADAAYLQQGTGYQLTSWNNDCQSCQSGGHHGGVSYAGGTCYAVTTCNHCNACDSCPLGMCVDGDSCLTNSCLNDTCLGRFCATKAYPDAGWAPPARLPVNRTNIWYNSYWPQAFYGNPGGGFVGNYPQVYQPTDTTQLGYYYGHVPTWQSRPGMIPPVPNPSNFHHRVCPTGYGHGCNTCNGGVHHGYAAQGVIHDSHVVHAQQTKIVRPASNNSGRKFSFASLTNLFD